MVEAFEPLNDSNKVGEINRVDPTAPPAPIDLQSRGDAIRVDTNTLTTDELNICTLLTHLLEIRISILLVTSANQTTFMHIK